MDLFEMIINYFWIFVVLIILYLVYKKLQTGQGVGKIDWDQLKIILLLGSFIFAVALCQEFLFTHNYIYVFIIIYLPILTVFLYLLISKNNVFIIESTLDSEIFYDLGTLDKQIAQATRSQAYVIDRDAYNEIRHIGEIDYPYWDGGDNVKFTDYFDAKNGVMYHPPVAQLHNISFYVAKSFWLKMKLELPNIIRENTVLTWLAPYRTAHEQSKLAKNFIYRLKNIERQYENEAFSLPDDMKTLWQKEIEERRKDREANEFKISMNPESPNTNTESEGGETNE